MKLPPQVIIQFLLSMGAPPAVVELLGKFQAQGLGDLRVKPAAPDDPTWELIKASPDVQRNGFWVRAQGPNSRVTAGIFFEGMDDETVSQLASLTGVPRPTLGA